MKDFQQYLKLVLEAGEMLPNDPKTMPKAPGFTGTLETATTPTEAFQAFKTEHNSQVDALKGQVQELIQYMTGLSKKTGAFAQSVNAPKFNPANVAADPKAMARPGRLDPNKLDAMKSYWQGGKQESTVHEDFEVGTGTQQTIMASRDNLDAKFNEFKKNIDGLIARMTKKMASFSSQMADLDSSNKELGSSLEDYKSKYEDLQQRFTTVNEKAGKATGDIESLAAKIEKLETSGREVDQQTIAELRQNVQGFQEQIKKIQDESQQAMAQLADAQKNIAKFHADRSAAASGHQEMYEKYAELENWADEIHAAYEELSKNFKDTKKKLLDLIATAGKMVNVTDKDTFAQKDFGATDVAHTNHFGKFSLMDHLELARKKQGTIPGSGWSV